MEKLVYDFELMIKDGLLKVGDEIYAPNGRQAEVVSITSIKIMGWSIKVEGKAKLKKL